VAVSIRPIIRCLESRRQDQRRGCSMGEPPPFKSLAPVAPLNAVSSGRVVRTVREFGVKLDEMGIPLLDFDPHERVLSFQVPYACAKFRQNRIQNCDRESEDTQTDRHTDTQRSRR